MSHTDGEERFPLWQKTEILTVAIVNTLCCLFVIITFHSVEGIKKDSRAVRHILNKCMFLLPFNVSYFLTEWPTGATSGTWECNVQFGLQALFGPSILTCELCIALEILIAVRMALRMYPDSIAMELKASRVVQCIYSFSMIWGAAGIVSACLGASAVGTNDRAFCWFGDFNSKFLFFYLPMFICMGFCVGVLLYLLWLEHRHSIPLNDVNMLLIELSVAFIATWIVPTMHRIAQEQKHVGSSYPAWMDTDAFRGIFLFCSAGSSVMDCLMWLHYPPVRSAILPYATSDPRSNPRRWISDATLESGLSERPSRAPHFSKVAVDGLSTALLAAESPNRDSSSLGTSAHSTIYTRTTRSGTGGTAPSALSMYDEYYERGKNGLAQADRDGDEGDQGDENDKSGPVDIGASSTSARSPQRPNAVL